jgi:hypothetical protein
MNHRHHLNRLILTLLVAWGTGLPADALTIDPTQPGATTTFDAHEDYTVGTDDWQVSINPISVTTLTRGGTAGLLALLTDFSKAVVDGGGGWTFTTAASDLNGTFRITQYDAYSPSTVAGIVGANFNMDWIAGTGDPTGVEWHWIQRVYDNHGDGGHGTNEDLIDATVTSALTDPGRLFYDWDVGFADGTHFEDGPSRGDEDAQHSWNAELFLASIPNSTSKNVTIYNGVSWGWVNAPEPSTIALMAVGLAVLGARRRRAAAGRRPGV